MWMESKVARFFPPEAVTASLPISSLKSTMLKLARSASNKRLARTLSRAPSLRLRLIKVSVTPILEIAKFTKFERISSHASDSDS